MRKYINKPTDAYVSDLTSFINDSMVAMTKCMMDVAKDRITKEINSDYPDAETIAKEGKFLEDASNYIDAVRDFDNIKRVRSLKKYEKLKSMGVEVYSVSTDSHFVHKAWHDASDSIRKINYPMLADPTGALSRGFGVMIEEDGMAYRGTFLVNPEGKIKIAEIQDNSIGRNADELVRKVEAAIFVANHPGEVCPAKWKQGAETLKPSIDLVGKI